MREFDRRRTLARQGKLDELPREADDFDISDVETTAALDSERRLYTSPRDSSDRVESGGDASACVPHQVKTTAAAKPGSKGPSVPFDSKAGSAAAPHGEAITTMASSSDDEDHPISADKEGLMGSSSDDRFQNMDLVNGEEIIGPQVRPGRTPTVAGSAGAPDQSSAGGESVVGFHFEPADELSEQDALDAAVDDDDAARFGPLTERELKKYRKELKIDPRAQGILQFDQRNAIERLAEKVQVKDAPPRSLPISPDEVLPKLKAAEVDVNNYLSIIGSCLHLAQVSRQDIAFAVGLLSRHAATPGVVHLRAALNLVKYLCSTRDLYVQYTRDPTSEGGNDPQVFGKGWREDKTIEERLVPTTPDLSAHAPTTFVDADHGGDAETRRSTSGLIIMMNGGPVAWFSRLQKLCALSTAESEIYAAVDAAKEALHLRLLCEEMGVRPLGKPMRVYEDNTACIHMGHSLRGSNAARHFQLRLRFLHERIVNDEIEFAKVDTKGQLADGFTKAFPLPAFTAFRSQLLKGD